MLQPDFEMSNELQAGSRPLQPGVSHLAAARKHPFRRTSSMSMLRQASDTDLSKKLTPNYDLAQQNPLGESSLYPRDIPGRSKGAPRVFRRFYDTSDSDGEEGRPPEDDELMEFKQQLAEKEVGGRTRFLAAHQDRDVMSEEHGMGVKGGGGSLRLLGFKRNRNDYTVDIPTPLPGSGWVWPGAEGPGQELDETPKEGQSEEL